MKHIFAAVAISLAAIPAWAQEWPVLNQDGNPVEFFQPDPEVMKDKLGGVVTADQARSAASVGHYPIVGGIPYYLYWLLEPKGSYAFHPSATASVLSILAQNGDMKRLSDILDATLPLVADLPNGGLAWYYPKVYINNRMVGPLYHYSVISQARLVAAALNMEAADPAYREFLERAAKGMTLDYREGGILWDDNIFLEFPLHYSPPEVILNGWIDGLLNYGDLEGLGHEKLYLQSVARMADMLPIFDDEEHRLSLYSDTSPVRSFISRSEDEQAFSVEFTARGGYPNYSIDLATLPPVVINGKELRSPYETQVYNDNGSVLTVSLSCNQKYDTYVVSDAPFTLKTKLPLYDPNRATPALGDDMLSIESAVDGDSYVVHLDQERDKLFCGYPTNFAKKGGENFYHPYHIVGLLYLALDERLDDGSRAKMIEYARKWMRYATELESEGFRFTEYQRVLDAINSHKFDVTVSEWEDLKSRALD